MKIRQLMSVAMVAVMVSACAPAPQEEANDPLEPVNRQIFAFNEVVDQVVLRPVASGYRAVVPEQGRKGVRNVLSNMLEPVVVVNSLLQGDVTNAFTSFWRFVINSTLGMAGIYDFAGKYAGLEHRSEDFGQTLAVWTGGQGPYLVLPIFGPSSGTALVGRVADYYSDPFAYILRDKDVADGDEWTITRGVVSGISARESALDIIDEMYETSLDPYATIRSAYTQRRQSMIENRNVTGANAITQ